MDPDRTTVKHGSVGFTVDFSRPDPLPCVCVFCCVYSSTVLTNTHPLKSSAGAMTRQGPVPVSFFFLCHWCSWEIVTGRMSQKRNTEAEKLFALRWTLSFHAAVNGEQTNHIHCLTRISHCNQSSASENGGWLALIFEPVPQILTLYLHQGSVQLTPQLTTRV